MTLMQIASMALGTSGCLFAMIISFAAARGTSNPPEGSDNG